MTDLSRRWRRLLLPAVVLLLCPPAGAIIIRHDKGVGSYLASEAQFPAVFYLEQQGNRKVCVATLIDPSWAITAAHCVTETRLLQTLAGGEEFAVRVAGRQRRIGSLVIHPAYANAGDGEVDLALLRFTVPVDSPIPIPLYDRPDEHGQVAHILGWGYFGLGTTGREYADGQFRMAQNRLEVLGNRLQMRFDDPRAPGNQVLELEGMPGLGDSGGPALVRTAEGWALAGVAVGELMGMDFSEETQGIYGSVAIYERISSQQDWIEATMAGFAVDRVAAPPAG